LMQAIQNIGLALCTMLCGLTVDSYGYIWLEIFFIGWVAIALLCTFAIWIIDIQTTGYLNMGAREREAYGEEIQRRSALKKEKEESQLKEGLRPRTHVEIRNR
ncbi:Uncharacterized protein FKW44_000522, partial [Caligus rogercresseyi]